MRRVEDTNQQGVGVTRGELVGRHDGKAVELGAGLGLIDEAGHTAAHLCQKPGQAPAETARSVNPVRAIPETRCNRGDGAAGFFNIVEGGFDGARRGDRGHGVAMRAHGLIGNAGFSNMRQIPSKPVVCACWVKRR